MQKATQTPKASFFVSCHRTAIRSMVVLAGLPKGRPVPFCAGSLNPVSATAIEIETSRGSSLN
ncbi:TPA: ash family protein [Escherichia coli]|nr:ash family protein [Escherichia coli]